MLTKRLAILTDKLLIVTWISSLVSIPTTGVVAIVRGGVAGQACAWSVIAFSASLAAWCYLNKNYIEPNYPEYTKE
jgi:hypothetical protein